MKPPQNLERVFPPSAGSPARVLLRAPSLPGGVNEMPRFVMGNRSFMRTWAARRAKALPAPPVRNS